MRVSNNQKISEDMFNRNHCIIILFISRNFGMLLTFLGNRYFVPTSAVS